jgi:hypothetical protein
MQSLYKDLKLTILELFEVTDWPAICLTSKEFNELMKTIKLTYFRQFVIHDAFLPKEFCFKWIVDYRDYRMVDCRKFLQPVFNYDLKIHCERGFKRDRELRYKFKFAFSEFKFIFGALKCAIVPHLHNMTPLVHHTPENYCDEDDLEPITRFCNKNFKHYEYYFMIQFGQKKVFITRGSCGRGFIPKRYLKLEYFPSIAAFLEKYSESFSKDLEILKALAKEFKYSY